MEMDYEALAAQFPAERRYQPLSPYAGVKRDLALVCDEAVACGQLEEVIRESSPLVQEVRLFDVYRGKNLGEGKKSMAFSVTLHDRDKDLSAEAAERAVKNILGNLKYKLGVQMR